MTEQDQTIASIGLPRHPPVKDLADTLEAVASDLRSRGNTAIGMAANLAANGYPASTIGDGGSRGTEGTSSTERSAQRSIEHVQRWANADRNLARLLRDLDRQAKVTRSMIANLLHHATDVDPVPVGTGECQACGRFCRPDKDRPGNRLCSGLCPTDYRAWRRYVTNGGTLPRTDWVHDRRRSFTDDRGVLHTPEPDHDLDLTSERPSASPT